MALLLRYSSCSATAQNGCRGTARRLAIAQHYTSQQRTSTRCSATPLKQQRCEPCEEAKREAEYMGLHPMVMDRPTAEKYKEQVSKACSSHPPPKFATTAGCMGGAIQT
jgi:hypothetical protein